MLPTISLPTLKFLKPRDIVTGAILCLGLIGLIALWSHGPLLVPTEPPTRVAPAAAVPLPREVIEPQEGPQEPQGSPKTINFHGNPRSAPITLVLPLPLPDVIDIQIVVEEPQESPTLAPAVRVLPLPPTNAVEVQVEVEVEKPAAQQNRCRHRRWFRW